MSAGVASRGLPEGLPDEVGVPSVARFDPLAWRQEPVEAVLLTLPTALAGKGTARQLTEAAAYLSRRLEASDVPFAYVGRPVEDGGSELQKPWREVAPYEPGVPGIYRATARAFREAFEALHARDVRRVAVLCMGYTGYGPEAIKRSLAELARGGRRMEAVVCLADSAYPDTDVLDRETDAQGWPISRFYGPAYRSVPGAQILFFLTSAYPYDPAVLNRRVPPGIVSAGVIVPPYSDEYVERIETAGREGREEGLGEVASRLPGLEARDDDDLLIPIVGSDIWSTSAIGAWMSAPQHDSCLKGTAAIVRALVTAGDRLGKRIWVPIDVAGADYLREEKLPGVTVLLPGEVARGAARVFVSPYRDLSQRDHARLLGASDLAISRTGGQANSTVVLALARTPNLVLDMPACGYMQSELTSLAVRYDVEVDAEGRVRCRRKDAPLGWLARWDWAPERIAEEILDALGAEDERARRCDAAYRAYEALRRSEAGNLFRIVERLAGKR